MSQPNEFPPNPNSPNFGGGGFNPPPEAKKKSPLPWILGILAGVVLLSALCCGGFAYFGFSMVGPAVRQEIEPRLNANADFQENIGTIESFDWNFGESTKASQGGQQKLVFDVEGSKGSGMIRVQQTPGPQGQFGNVELVLSDGTVIPIDKSDDEDDNSTGDSPEGSVESLESDLGVDAEPAPAN